MQASIINLQRLLALRRIVLMEQHLSAAVSQKVQLVYCFKVCILTYFIKCVLVSNPKCLQNECKLSAPLKFNFMQPAN